MSSQRKTKKNVRPNPVASALMAKMGMSQEERPRVKLECLRLLATLQLNRARMRLISGFIDTYLRLTASEALIFRERSDSLPDTEKEKVMQLTTSWKEEGRQEGRLEEIQQTVSRLLRRRWGDVPPALASRLQTLPIEDMENLAEALFDFTSMADLEKWLGEAPRQGR